MHNSQLVFAEIEQAESSLVTPSLELPCLIILAGMSEHCKQT